MIVTKSGGDGEGLGVTYNVNYTNETPLDFTDYQYEYGQGENGVRPTEANPTSGQWSFGERFEPGMTQVLFDGIVLPYERCVIAYGRSSATVKTSPTPLRWLPAAKRVALTYR